MQENKQPGPIHIDVRVLKTMLACCKKRPYWHLPRYNYEPQSKVAQAKEVMMFFGMTQVINNKILW